MKENFTAHDACNAVTKIGLAGVGVAESGAILLELAGRTQEATGAAMLGIPAACSVAFAGLCSIITRPRRQQ